MSERTKKYFKTEKGKKALNKARKAYDQRDPERRRKQKRDYMRRKREENPDAWKHNNLQPEVVEQENKTDQNEKPKRSRKLRNSNRNL
jgi:hypothetical protein